MTIEASVYTAIRSGHLTRAALVSHLGLDTDTVGGALIRLSQKGWVKPSGPKHATEYLILRDILPTDGRGKGPGSARGRAKSSKFNGQSKPKPVVAAPRPATALEQAWGWMPSSPMLSRAAKSVPITGGAVRPQEP